MGHTLNGFLWVSFWGRLCGYGYEDRVRTGFEGRVRAMYGQEWRYWTVPAFFKVVTLEDMLQEGLQGCKIFWNMVLQDVHLHSLLRNGKRSDCPIV